MNISKSGIWRGVIIGIALVLALTLGAFVFFKDTVFAQMAYRMHSAGHMHGAGGMGHGAGGMGHDMTNMPGLRGANATDAESAELAVMFNNFDTITREVTLLPDGIRTVTRSSDPDVMNTLVSHITGMTDRVTRGDDPEIFIQSPTLDIFFERGAGIDAQIDITDEGIVVQRTSDDPDVVAALHLHAAEVSDMADRGMQAVHEAMARRAGN